MPMCCRPSLWDLFFDVESFEAFSAREHRFWVSSAVLGRIPMVSHFLRTASPQPAFEMRWGGVGVPMTSGTVVARR